MVRYYRVSSEQNVQLEGLVLYLLRHLTSILLLPFTVTVLIPLWLLRNDPARESPPQLASIRLLIWATGATALALGLTLFVSTVLHFARTGKGTLAPWDPPRVLVVQGVYRYVRNPMISGVLFILFAEAVLTGSRRLLAWFGVFLLINLIYIPLLEETGLVARFGERYLLYKKNVPRWIPRLKPWLPPWK